MTPAATFDSELQTKKKNKPRQINAQPVCCTFMIHLQGKKSPHFSFTSRKDPASMLRMSTIRNGDTRTLTLTQSHSLYLALITHRLTTP